MAARMKFVSNRRMKLSKAGDVGQMRKSKGISMKRMMNEETLFGGQ